MVAIHDAVSTARQLQEDIEDIEPIDDKDYFLYVCRDASSTCPYTCQSLAECESCECAVQDEGEGPWGKAMDVIFCLLPIVFLVIATVPPFGLKALPTTKSLPMSAFLMFLVRLMYLGSDPLLVCGSIVKGVHEAITPLTIMFGAIFLFETMEATRCLPFMMREMKALTQGHGAAELCVIFCFATMVEGASGFGTPAALGAPMLISLGHPKLESVVVLLLVNTFATVFGAVGTPLWYGFGSLGLSEEDLGQIAFNSAVALVVSAYLLVPFIFATIVPLEMVKDNIIFILLALSGCMLPLLGISFVSYEFPSLIGGIIGMGITTVLVHFKIGLKPVELKACPETGRHPMDIASVSERGVVALSSSCLSKSQLPAASALESGNITPMSMFSDGPVHKKSYGEADEWENNEEFANPGQKDDTSDNLNDVCNGEVSSSQENNDDQEENEISRDGLKRKDSSMSSDDFPESLRAVEASIGPRKSGMPYVKEFLLRTSPITLTVLLLIITRLPQLGLNKLLKKTAPNMSIYFGTYGTFRLSASLVFQLENILTYPNLNWKYELLYTPFVIPFILVSVITYCIYRKESSDNLTGIFVSVFGRVKSPAVALAGALSLVQLMITGEEAAPASIIGIVLSDAFKGGWIAIAAAIGALGSFFSGSTTVSNLTFGSVQQIAAEGIEVNVNAMLALQVVGASAGNGICLNNIISVCTVTGLVIGEGKIIAKTAKFVLLFIVIATLIMLAFLL